jgi:uncharacterized membrane protein YdbT with pleckstrin-like domain
MGFLEANLQSDEKIELRIDYTRWWWLEVLIGFIIIIGIPAAISTIIRKLTLEQAVTNKRVIQKTGLISRNIEEMRLSKIETVEFNQSILGRIMGMGTLRITGVQSKLILYGVDHPKDIKKKIDSLLN